MKIKRAFRSVQWVNAAPIMLAISAVFYLGAQVVRGAKNGTFLVRHVYAGRGNCEATFLTHKDGGPSLFPLLMRVELNPCQPHVLLWPDGLVTVGDDLKTFGRWKID